MRAGGDCRGSKAQNTFLVNDEDIFVTGTEISGDARGTREQGRRYPGLCQIGCCLCAIAIVSVECEDLDAGFVAVGLVNLRFEGGTRPYASPSVVADKKEDGDRVVGMTDAVRPAIGSLKLKFAYFFTHLGLSESGCA